MLKQAGEGGDGFGLRGIATGGQRRQQGDQFIDAGFGDKGSDGGARGNVGLEPRKRCVFGERRRATGNRVERRLHGLKVIGQHDH